MFNSTKLRDFSMLHVTSDPTNDTTRTTNSFTQPKVTSTPLRRESIFATPPKPRLLTPRRYSLSEIATPPRINRRDSIRAGSQNLPGPLLASTKYNVSVSTYEDTKAPGLAGRIVQYHEEAERQKEGRRLPTHQAKYGSPGLFPIVHLFKKKLPVLEQKPRHVTVRIASDHTRQHSQEYQRQLLGSIIKSGGNSHVSQSGAPNSTSPRSVLDALKEISRKRLHANEVVETHEDNNSKRIRTENGGLADSNKRPRDKSPPLEDVISPSKPVPKKICMYDEYAASRSSMDFSVVKKAETPVPKRKSMSINTLTDTPKESKQIKLVNAGTQTPAEEADKSTNTNPVENQKEQNQTETDADPPAPAKRTVPLKVFDDAPLERIRKNRLAALLGSLAGVDPVLEPKPDKASLLNESEIPEKSEKPLVSILTAPHKTADKLDKHVHFKIPESSTQSSNSSSSSSVSDSSTSGLVLPPAEPGRNLAGFAPTVPPVPSFGKDQAVSAPTPSFSLPKIASSTDVPSLLGGTAAKASPPKVGGFKFDLEKPRKPPLENLSTSTVTSPTPSFSFGPKPTAAVSASSTKASPVATLALSPIVSSSATPSFNLAPKPDGISFGGTAPLVPSFAAAATVETSKPPMFSFGASTAFGPPKTSAAGFGAPTPSFGTPPSNGFGPAVGGFSTPATTAGTGFGSPATTTFGNKPMPTPPAYGANSSFTSTAAPAFWQDNLSSTKSSGTAFNSTGFVGTSLPQPISFGGAAVTQASGFGVPSTSAPQAGSFGGTQASGFGANAPSAPQTASFGGAVVTQASGFGAPSTNTTSAPQPASFGTQPSGFGAPSTNTTSAPPQPASFGTQPSGFGAPSANAASAPQPASFGTQPSGFGAPSTNSSAPQSASFGAVSGFGAPSANSASAPQPSSSQPASFGTQPSGFGAPSTNPASALQSGGFGGTTVTQPSGFGAPSAAAPSFGNSTAPATFSFGPKTTANAFGGFGTPTTATSTFGGGFAAPTTSTNAFSGFGAAPATTASSAFGGFGTATTSASNMFGGFGTASARPTNNGFGGATAQANSFGTPSAVGFGAGAPAPSFGGFGAPAAASAGAFNFSSTAPKPGGVFSFGGAAPPEKPKFEFGGGGTAAPAFGAAFGASGGFGASGFGAPQNAVAGTFSIGSGPQSSGRPRAQIKAKRRT